MARPPLPLGTWGKINRTQMDNGRWRARAKYRDFDGRTRWVERFGPTGAAAERVLLEAMQDRSGPNNGEITRDTSIEVLGEKWLEGLEADDKVSAATLKSYRSAVRQINKAMGSVRIHEASAGLIDKYLRARPSPASAKTARSVLIGMMALAVRHEARDHNPVRDAVNRTVETADPRALTDAQFIALRGDICEWIGGNDTGPARGADLVEIVDVLLGTSARIGEVLAIRKRDINFTTNEVEINGTVVDGARQPWPKGKTPRRQKVPAFVMSSIRRQIARDLPSEDGLLFPGRHGGPRSVSNFERLWRRWREEYPEWEWVTPHTFRKTGGTAVARALGVEAAAEQLGNTLQVAQRHYIEKVKQGPDTSGVLDRFGPLRSVDDQDAG